METVNYEDIAEALKPFGLIVRGGFHPHSDDDIPAETLILIGNAGSDLWQSFTGPDGTNHPLDNWCRKTLSPVALSLGADILFPFDGPPYHPFISWGKRAEGLQASPIGPLIHPYYGLWHAYRGALLFSEKLEVPAPASANPCASCADKPCLTTCPVEALDQGSYDVSVCISHIKSPIGDVCIGQGCLARCACPVGEGYRYLPEQAAFHMVAFVQNH